MSGTTGTGTAVPELADGYRLQADAWTGDATADGSFVADPASWLAGRFTLGEPTMRPHPPDPWDWRHPDIGWGVVAREPDGLSRDELVDLVDLPEDVRRLVDARRGRVFRYRPGTSYADWTLTDYAGDAQVFVPAAPAGADAGRLPMYLLVYGSPEQVPWRVQYILNPVRYVGRLDLEGPALTRYVDALLGEWAGSTASWSTPLVWAVDHQAGEITTLMRDVVAQQFHDTFAADDELTPTFLDGRRAPATVGALTDALVSLHPAVIVTCSHGQTGPLADLDRMRADLGLLVDQDHALLDPQTLLSRWQPDGAVWFAQACCSAGADSPTAYEGLVDGRLADTLRGIARLGATTSPLPRALLGAEQPLRAFVGHVEPTFNWTLEFPPNQADLTDSLRRSLYDRLFSGRPVGYCMEPHYDPVASLLQSYRDAEHAFQETFGAAARTPLATMVYRRVTAHDRTSTVVLGDPTVAVPLPPAGPATHPRTPPEARP
ncbi:hypothetical protein ATJ88_1833 [Isoptericola jiangsuensis]|uniref:CHAT domain-containing protein n=1 Tax=Isoptericola jiangsuensis TaxID=548579 RepID=A0A2A9EYA6_9MICO|nr:hypothetical protein [Isoptericola jiangsuensis]PFG43149.1 hypothetical protein ATJ88_1833 [Isoptericola jiangsuensis]